MLYFKHSVQLYGYINRNLIAYRSYEISGRSKAKGDVEIVDLTTGDVVGGTEWFNVMFNR